MAMSWGLVVELLKLLERIDGSQRDQQAEWRDGSRGVRRGEPALRSPGSIRRLRASERRDASRW